MKTLLFLTINIFLSIPVISQNITNYFYGIRNEPKLIKQNKILSEKVSYLSVKKNIQRDTILTEIYTYDSSGNGIESKSKFQNKKESIRKFIYTYSASGLISKIINEYIGFNMTSIYEYDYDNHGNLIMKYDYNKDTSRMIVEKSEYDQNNQIRQLSTKINEADFYISRRYFYNTKQQKIKEEGLSPKGQVIFYYLYEYDDVDHKTKIYLNNEEGNKLIDENYYNKDNRLIKTASKYNNSEPNNLNKLTEYIYNSDYTISECNVYLDGKKVQVIKHDYIYYKK